MSEATEIEKFNALAEDWWHVDGTMAMLHAMHPVRMRFLCDQLERHYPQGFSESAALDVGCGGGIAAESLARLGFRVTGVDASPRLIQIARHHAEQANLAIAYHHADFTDYAEQHPASCNVLCAFEVIEHITDQQGFLADCARCLRSGGLLVLSTLHRTLKSRFLGIALAEYALRLLPIGTHDWHKFIKPSEIAAALPNCRVTGLAGMRPDATGRGWNLHRRRIAVNYVMALKKHEETGDSNLTV